jgi:hypothetical protein
VIYAVAAVVLALVVAAAWAVSNMKVHIKKQKAAMSV